MKKLILTSAVAAAAAAGVGWLMLTTPKGIADKPIVPAPKPEAVIHHEHAPPAAASQPASEEKPAPATKNWTEQFHGSNDYLAFIKQALPAANAGDSRAAWYIARALQSCGYVMRMYHGVENPEAQLQQELTSFKGDQWVRDQHELKTRRCLSLARDGAPDGQTFAYWDAQALKLGDPLALEDAAAKAVADIAVDREMPADTKKAKLAQAQGYLKAVVASGDVEALYRAGNLLANPAITDDTMHGFALALAACNLGRDCSADNPDNVFYGCKFSGSCPPNADYAYFLQQSLGQAGYAQLYARAQQLEQPIQARDWQTVLASLHHN